MKFYSESEMSFCISYDAYIYIYTQHSKVQKLRILNSKSKRTKQKNAVWEERLKKQEK
jgi:hypothetical protein